MEKSVRVMCDKKKISKIEMKDVQNGGESSNDWVGDSSSEKAELEGAEVKGLSFSLEDGWDQNENSMRTSNGH